MAELRALAGGIFAASEGGPLICLVASLILGRGLCAPTDDFKVSWKNGIAAFQSPISQSLWSFGVDCVDTGTSKKDYKPSNKSYAAFKLFANDAEWVHDTLAKLKSWGFNSTGGWSNDDLFRKYGGQARLPYFVVLHLGAYDLAPWHDLFAKQMEKASDDAAKKLIPPLANDPFLVGYFSDNELGWWDDTLFLNYLNLGKDAPGRTKLLYTLRVFYKNDLSKLRQDWTFTGQSFDDLHEMHLRPGGDGRKAVDAFTEVLGRRYYSLMQATIRRYDKRHLILGDRYCQYYTLPIVRAAKDYVDVVSTNFGADWNDGSIAPFFLRTLNSVTQKPVIVTEFYMCATQNRSGNKNSSPAFPVVETQTERANAVATYVTSVARLPYTVGAHWFQFSDEPANGRGDGEDFNMGLLDTDGRPYEELINACSSINLNSLRSTAQDPLPAIEFAVPRVDSPSLTTLKNWPRKSGTLRPVSGTPFGDMFVAQDPENLYIGLFAMDYMDESLYAGGHIPEIDRNHWTISITGLDQPILVRYGGKGRRASVNISGVEVHEAEGLKYTVTLKVPKDLFRHRSQIGVSGTLRNHGHSQEMSWKGLLQLGENR